MGIRIFASMHHRAGCGLTVREGTRAVSVEIRICLTLASRSSFFCPVAARKDTTMRTGTATVGRSLLSTADVNDAVFRGMTPIMAFNGTVINSMRDEERESEPTSPDTDVNSLSIPHLGIPEYVPLLDFVALYFPRVNSQSYVEAGWSFYLKVDVVYLVHLAICVVVWESY